MTRYSRSTACGWKQLARRLLAHDVGLSVTVDEPEGRVRHAPLELLHGKRRRKAFYILLEIGEKGRFVEAVDVQDVNTI